MSPAEKIRAEYYTEKEIAEALGITVSAMRSRRSEGRNHPPCLKLGQRILFPKREFDLWLKKQPVVRSIA